MANLSPPEDLAERAGRVFALAGELGGGLPPTTGVNRTTPGGVHPESDFAAVFWEYWDAFRGLRGVIEKPPKGFRPIAGCLREAVRVAREIRPMIEDWDGERPEFRKSLAELQRVAREGETALKSLPSTPRETEGKKPDFTLLDRYPADPAGHLKFLEFVRQEIRYAADAQRHQLLKGYDNSTIARMLDGIQWAEALRRLLALPDLPETVRTECERVLRRDLTPATIERIDTLFGPLVESLREAWELARFDEGGERRQTPGDRALWKFEDRPKTAADGPVEAAHTPAVRTPEPAPDTGNKSAQRTRRGGAEIKLIAALTKHHQYSDGSCLNSEPITNKKLAALAGVAESTVSAFMKKQFKGQYEMLCRNTSLLISGLKLLNREYSPHVLVSALDVDNQKRTDDV